MDCKVKNKLNLDTIADNFYTHLSMGKNKILIIGAGISGLSLAINLKKILYTGRLIIL
ncbi:MAG: hypothetical protein U9N32_02325 [Spirochaetota bacterium]|nr:hypothetical protein [Spirochaetota bacterium]